MSDKPLSNDGCFRILSIDGGGTKGIFSAQILTEIEKCYRCKIADVFDMICGTSTGGLIALALSQRIPAEDIVSFYFRSATTIFPKSFKFVGGLRQRLWGGKYHADGLRNVLSELLGDTLMSDAVCHLCIPSYSLIQGQPRIFKTDPGNLNRDNGKPMVDVGMATCAAPTFFPIAAGHESDEDRLIDGGLYANNPAHIGFVEAIRHFVGPGKEFSKLALLSVPSLSEASGETFSQRVRRSAAGWGKKLVTIPMTGTSYVTDFMMNTISNSGMFDMHYYRFPTPQISEKQGKLIALDATDHHVLTMMNEMGRSIGSTHSKGQEVMRFFPTKI